MTLIEKIKDPAFWEKVKADELYAPLIGAALRTYEQDMPYALHEIPYTVAADFQVSGDRITGEKIIMHRRRAMVACGLLSLVYPEKEEYFNHLQDILFAICNEYTWEIPAHIPNMTDYIPDDIDLVAAETGFYLSEIYTIFEQRLDPLVKTRIKMEVERRIIKPFMDESRNFAWINYHSNWAAVCGGSVGATFMYLFPEKFPLVRHKIDKAIENFLLSYRDSGYCYEGIGYWEYGFGFFVCYAQILYDFTNGKEDLFALPKVKAISSFPQKMFLSGDALVSFSDARMSGTVNRGLCHFLASKYPDTVIPAPQNPSPKTMLADKWGLNVREFAWFDPTTERAQESYSDYSLDAQWLVYRTPNFGFATKGGCNWEAHNHNDVGSFIFATGGNQVLADVGAPQYTRQYFREETRYQYFNPSSRAHNVPILFGKHQKTGRQYRAEGAVYDGKTFTYDFASAYDIPEVVGLQRTFLPDKKGVTLTDEITYAKGVTAKKGDFIERFVFTSNPVVEGNTVKVGGAILTLTGVEAPTLSSEHLTVTNGGEAWTCYILDFPVTGTSFSLRMEVEKK